MNNFFYTLMVGFLFCAGTDSQRVFADSIIEISAVPTNAMKPIGLLWQEKQEFAPVQNERYSFKFALDKIAKVDFEVLGPDGDLVRSLFKAETMQPGEHDLSWDGRDDNGDVVPDEVYTPRFVASTVDNTTVDNPRSYSGGEILPNLRWTRRNETEISYQLDEPARVLIRVGVNDGPMLHEIMHWHPVSAGRAVVRWDGRDKDGVNYFADRKDLWTVVMAYRLPEFAVITSGNKSLSYNEYRQRMGWENRLPNLSSVPLERGGSRLSRDYFVPRGYLPRVSLEFADNLETSRFGLPVAGESLLLRVNVPEEDRWILDSSFYETGFYVNYEFRSEEEQGFVPMIWSLDTSSLEPGRHLATVQLFGFGGFIASDTVEFLVDVQR